MRRSSSARGRRVRSITLLLALGGLIVFGLLPRAASATLMADMRPQAPSMTAHAPIEIRVSPELKKVLEGLLCQCGCNLDAYQCQQTMTCQVSTDMWDQAERMVGAQGRSPEQALRLFAADYGERVLASPTREGFNLTAWALPFAALAIGLAIVAVVLRRWRPGTAEAHQDVVDVDPKYLEQIERELVEED